MMPPRLCATKMIGRLLVCRDLALVWCLVYLLRTSVICLSRHRSDTSVCAWLNRYWQLTRDLLPHDLPNARILSWGYDANTHSRSRISCQYLFDHARTLVSDLCLERQITEVRSR